MITPAFTGQYYQDTTTKKLWKSNSTTAGDWTAVGNFNKSGAGDPTGVETPDFTGQTYRDTATGNIWTSTGLTNADWSLTVQDMQVRWEPKNISIAKSIGFTSDSYWGMPPLENITSLTFNQATTDYFYLFEYPVNLASLSFPYLTTILGAEREEGWSLKLEYMEAINSISAPLLQHIDSDVRISGNNTAPLSSLSLPSLTECLGDVFVSGFPALSNVSIPVFLPTNGKAISFANTALNLASVDHILARAVASASYVSGTINTSGGTSAAPTQGAGSSHDILVARGVTITHN